MAELLTPGVTFEVADRGRGGISPLRTDVAGFVGMAERGSLDHPVRVGSFEQFRSLFGGLLPNAFLAYAVKAFFENGGRLAWIVRVAAEAVETASDVAGSQERGFATVSSVSGFTAGAAATVFQGELVTNVLVREVDSGRRRLVWERSLPPSFDPTLPFFVASGGGVARALLDGEDGLPTLRLRASSLGEWGNGLAVRVSRSVPSATRLADAPQGEDRRTSVLRSIAGIEAGALLRLAQDGPPGLEEQRREAHRVAVEVSAVSRQVIWDMPLSLDFDLGALGERPIVIEVLEFGLSVELAGRVVELYDGLSLVPFHPRYVETALAESRFARAEDLEPGNFSASRLPDPAGHRAFGGGRDGIAALEPRHLIGGSPGATHLGPGEERRGLSALEVVDEVAMVAIPDAMILPVPAVQSAPRSAPESDPCAPCPSCNPCDPCVPVPPEGPSAPPAGRLQERSPVFSLEQVFEIQQALVAHCEALRDRVAILDTPRFESASELGELTAWRRRFDSSYAALYYPWPRVSDPLAARDRRREPLREIPPSGHVAGLFARTDLDRGVHHAPANTELRWVEALTADIGDARQGLLHPLGINVLRALPGRGIRVWGARMATSESQWRHVPVRRLLLMIEEALEEAIQWAVFEPHDEALRQSVRLAVSTFLEGLWRRGALAGSRPAEAFFVQCDVGNNPPEVVEAGRLEALVGVAPAVPAEFVLVRIGRTRDALEIEELSRVAA